MTTLRFESCGRPDAKFGCSVNIDNSKTNCQLKSGVLQIGVRGAELQYEFTEDTLNLKRYHLHDCVHKVTIGCVHSKSRGHRF